MSSNWPKEIEDLETFLRNEGFECERREYPKMFGNKILQCKARGVAVQAVSDRGVWSVYVADIEGRPGHWYFVSTLRDLIVGSGKEVLSLAEQVDLIKANWAAIVANFSPESREETHSRLEALGKERARRMFP